LRILLDECVPRGLKRSLLDVGSVLTVPDAGLSGYKNGRLLSRISGDFDVFVTTDKSIQFQQNLAKYDIAFVLLRAYSNDIDKIRPLIPKLREQLPLARRRELLVIE
jgi:hypothetical protein